MNTGKQRIYDLPVIDITTLSSVAQRMWREAAARGEVLPPASLLHIGEPSFRTPEYIRNAAIHSIESEVTTYGPPEGWPWLRELLVEKIARINGYTVELGNIAISVGGTGAIMAALTATVGPGDEVLIPDPHWPQYVLQLACSGAVGVPYPLDPHNEWLPDIERLESLITPRMRMIIMNSPGNPTGAVFPRSIVEAMLDVARRHDLYLLSDECYDEIIFEGQHVSPATLLAPGEFEDGRVICVYTFSKTYAMTGWRIGYLVTGTKLMKTIIDVLNASTTNVSMISQRAAAAALTGQQDCVAEMRDTYKRRRDLTVNLLKDFGRYVYTPHGAFYTLVDVTAPDGTPQRGRQFALELLRQRNVTAAPGSGFGDAASHCVRVSLAASDEEIVRGVRAICEFADQ